ncbi:hypothetical protein ACTA71_002727 [Dictyostelium dimigraforme]
MEKPISYLIDKKDNQDEIVSILKQNYHPFLDNEYLPNCGTPDKNESPNLEEAGSCYELGRPPTRKFLAETDLIKAIDILYSSFNFNKLPVEVRLILEKHHSNNSIKILFGSEILRKQVTDITELEI